MKNLLLLTTTLLLFYFSCGKHENILAPVTPKSISVIQDTLICDNVALKFEFKQKLDATQPDSGELSLSITNMSSSNQTISANNPVIYHVNFIKDDVSIIENLFAMHSDTINELVSGEIKKEIISKHFRHEITDGRIQIDFIACGDTSTNSIFAGVYSGKCLIPMSNGTINDTVPVSDVRCIINSKGAVQIWIQGMEENSRFETRSILGNLDNNGRFYGRAEDLNRTFLSHLSIVDGNGIPNYLIPPNNLDDLKLKFYLSVPQHVYTTYTTTNLIFEFHKI